MQTTQLFVELLVIGVGALLWLGLLLAAIFGYNPQSGLPDLNTGVLAVLTGFLTGFGYALGIVFDRISRNICGSLFKADLPADTLERMERVIKTSNEALSKEIEYNRSRFRVCRSWALNLLLACGAFALWNIRVGVVPFWKCVEVIAMGCTLSGVTLWAAWRLLRDYEINLQESVKFLTSQDSRSVAE